MKIGLGFFCSTSDGRLSTNHKIKLKNLNHEAILKVFNRNLKDFVELLSLSKSMGLRIFRLGSDFIPFATHPYFKEEWLNEIEKILKKNSHRIRDYGIRITMHPGQYVVLNSSKEQIIKKSLLELKYHFWVLDALEFGKESIVVIHIGGVYGDKNRAIKRFEETLESNGWLTRRLALENDERYYNAVEVIEIAESFNVPAVFDYYHHILNPSEFNVDRLIHTWKGIIPETHLSSAPQGPHRFGEHGDYVDMKDFKGLISMFNEPIDIIIEAKKKEIAIARLIEELKNKDEVTIL